MYAIRQSRVSWSPPGGFVGEAGLSTPLSKGDAKRSLAEGFVIGIIGIIIIALSVRSVVRVLNWRNGLTLYEHDEQISKNAFDLENNLGVELYRAGRIEEAKPHFEASTRLAPFWWSNWNNLGVYYQRSGNLELAKVYYKEAMKYNDYYLAYQNYAGVLLNQNKIAEAKQFLEKEALPRLPYNPVLQKMWQFTQNK
jgi:tetratricopeptide (TPR) repeat protein